MTKQGSVEKVRNMIRPDDLHTIRVFMGLTSHSRGFIKDFAKIICILDRLKQKDVPFVWTDECEEAFIKIKELITSNPVLQLPDWKLPFELCTDASDHGTGAILYQRDKSKNKQQRLRVIGYFSHTFTKQQSNYSVTDEEGLSGFSLLNIFHLISSPGILSYILITIVVRTSLRISNDDSDEFFVITNR